MKNCQQYYAIIVLSDDPLYKYDVVIRRSDKHYRRPDLLTIDAEFFTITVTLWGAKRRARRQIKRLINRPHSREVFRGCP